MILQLLGQMLLQGLEDLVDCLHALRCERIDSLLLDAGDHLRHVVLRLVKRRSVLWIGVALHLRRRHRLLGRCDHLARDARQLFHRLRMIRHLLGYRNQVRRHVVRDHIKRHLGALHHITLRQKAALLQLLHQPVAAAVESLVEPWVHQLERAIIGLRGAGNEIVEELQALIVVLEFAIREVVERRH